MQTDTVQSCERNQPAVTGSNPGRTQILTAVLRRENDLYVAECSEVGTGSQGHSIEEAIANLKQATELYLEEFQITEFEPPRMTHFEVAIHA